MNHMLVLALTVCAAAVLGVAVGGALVWHLSVRRVERLRSDERLHQALQQLPHAMEQALRAEIEGLATRQASEERVRSALLERWQSEQSLRLARHEERIFAELQRHLQAVSAFPPAPAAPQGPPAPLMRMSPPPHRPAPDRPRPTAASPATSAPAASICPPELLSEPLVPPPPAVPEPEAPCPLHDLSDEEIDALPPDLPPPAPPARRLMRAPPKNTMRSL